MPDTPVLIQYQQGNDVSPAPEGYQQITGPLNPLRSTASRLSHFDEDVYDLSAESHLVLLIKAFLSDSGVGLLQKQMLLVRLQQSLSGTHYFDLDAFYGAIFGAGRKVDEILPHDPYGEPLSIEEWDDMQIRDGAYKARVSRLSQAIHLGATARGIRLFAEALTGVEFDLTEDWQYGPYMTHTWDDHDGELWDDLEAFSWDELERSPAATNERIRNIAILHPMRPLSEGEIFDLEQALDRLKPANMVVLVSNAVPDVDIHDVPYSPESNSERWEVRQLIQNSRINGILPFPNHPEDEFISPPLNPWAGYSGEAWTVMDRTPRTLAYVTQADVSTSLIIDPAARDMAPQALSGTSTSGQPIVSLPEFALKPVQGLYSGRSASDGIVTANPYGERSGTGSYLTIDGLPADFAERALSTSMRKTDLFWTSPNRPRTDSTNEVLEMRFDQPVNFNHVSFEFAKFPCRVSVQYWDRSDGQWITIGTIDQRESVPYSFPNQPPPDAPHPLHYGLGHWEKRSFSTTAVLTQNIRFVFKRIDGNGPVGNVGSETPQELAYPVGLREIDVGFRANSLSKVPHVSSLTPVSTSRNAAGLQTRYFLDVASADKVADDELTAWVSDPKPFAEAVVNMYLSVGDGTFPEVVNSLYLDPVHTGSIMNVYTTLDIPTGDALSEPRDDVVYAEVNGSVNPILEGNRGLDFPNEDLAWIDIDSLPLGGTSTGGQFWLGLSWEFNDFPVALAQGKFVTVASVALPDGHVHVSHGLEEGTDDYTIYTTVNGRVVKTKWPNFIPSGGKTLRLVIAAGKNFASALAQIDAGAVTPGVSVSPELSLGISTTFDPQTQRHPDDYYETKSKALPLALDAATHVGGSEWNGPKVADVTNKYFFGNRSDVTERFIYFPGNTSNYLNVPTNVSQTDLATSELIWGMVRAQPTSWVTGDERFFGGSLGFNVDAGGGFGWGLASDGRLMFEWDTGGTTNQIYSDFRIPRDTSRPIDIVFTLDTDTLRFFYKDVDSLVWNQVGKTLDATGITIGNPARAFRVGMACPDGGTRDPRPFLGAISQFRLATGITTLGADPDQFAGDMVIDIHHSDLGVLTPNTTLTTFTSSTGDTVAMLADDDGGTTVPLTVLSGPAFVKPTVSGSGIRVFDQVADVDFNHHLAATIVTSMPFAPVAGYAPVLTKKASSDSADRGWGIYLKSNGNFCVLASDGASQVETEWTSTGGAGPSQPPSCMSVQMLEGELRLANYQRGGVYAFDFAAEDLGDLTGLDNSQPVRVFADGTDTTAGIVYSVTAGSEERSSSVADFNLVSQSLAEMASYSSIGSSWTVTSSAQGLRRGSVLFQQSPGVVYPNGNITGSESFLVDSKSAEVRYGSASGRGTGIKLLGSVMGYGAGPGVSYLELPDAYNKIPLSNDTTKNLGTFLRYHPDYFGWTEGLMQSVGFMGGTPEAWGQARWKPLGQFVLSKGSYNFPDVLAKAIKLEFTQLTPEPYESFLPIDRTVSRMTVLTDKERGYSQSVQQQAAIEVLTPNRYSETPRFFNEGDPLLNNVSPTAGAVVTDGATRDPLAQQFGPLYGLASWQQSFHSTIQAETGVHSYEVTRVRSVTRTAFFVGLRTVRVRRVGQRAQRDNPYFWETFYDADNVDVPKTNFEIEPGQLYTPEFNSSTLMPFARQAVSKPFYTRSPIIGVQFATQQSQSFQVIPDDEFRSNVNKTSNFQIAEQWHRSGDGIVFWDQAYGSVRVSRDPAVLEAYYAPDTPIVKPPVSPVLSSGFARIITVDEDSSGGIESPNLLVAPRGVIWCAARVAAYNELNADLYLRAYDTATGEVLAEKAFRPKTGFPSEVTMSLISYRADPYGISVRVEQDGPYYDSWIMYALSAFDSSVLWEFSNDGGETWVPGYTARNLLNGVVEFPFTGSALMWRCKAYRYNAIIDAIEMRPWYSRRIGAPL